MITYVHKYIVGCAVCQANKVNTHPTVPASLSYHLTTLALSNKFLWTLSLIYPPVGPLILSWLW